MAIARLPAYVRPVKLAGDKTGYYFELPAWARPTKDPKTGRLTAAVRHGQACPVISTALGTDLAQVHAKGDALNEALREWRTGEMGQATGRARRSASFSQRPETRSPCRFPSQ